MDKLLLVDVGARGGISPRWSALHSRLEVIAFEPDRRECARLNERAWPYQVTFVPAALGATDGEQAKLYMCKAPGCSSLLHPNALLCQQFAYGANLKVIGEYPVTLNRMDSVVTRQPDVMKIDTQGTELEVLKGAGALLDDTMAVELEVEFVPQYEGQALFADVDAFMRSRGFWLRGLRRTFWRNHARYLHSFGGQLIHGDVLYIRPDKMNSPKGHLILAAYQQFDLLASYGADHLVPRPSLAARVLSSVTARYSNRELRRLVDRLRPSTATDWHDPDFF